MSPSVLVAMSGGVDSSVAACLLAEQGYDVMGSHMNLVHLEGVEHGCCGPAARADAAEVARIAGIPFEICDMTLEFDGSVIDDFISELESGRTPNPCARCNGEVKFGSFLSRADELGVDFVATGHYVRSMKDVGGTWRLRRGVDPSKDQSYMLHMLGQQQLSRSLFPIGQLSKPQTRDLAQRFGLPVAGKPDSQELCFAPSGDSGAFVRSMAPALVKPGEVVDARGQVMAKHDGVFAFTVGQRRGLNFADGTANYVIETDAAANRVIVGTAELLMRKGLEADRVSWVAGEPPSDAPFRARAQIRYRAEPVPALVRPTASGFGLEFDSPQRAIAPGQSAVLYDGDQVLGGGRIVSSR